MKTNGRTHTKVARVPQRAVGDPTALELPTDAYLCAALGSLALSLFFQAVRLRKSSLLVAQWVPALLLLGVYHKLLLAAEARGTASARAAERD